MILLKQLITGIGFQMCGQKILVFSFNENSDIEVLHKILLYCSAFRQILPLGSQTKLLPMEPKQNADNKIMGNNFEAYVGGLYQSLGYRVQYNVSLSGQQVDLLAEKIIPGAGESRIAIECKFQTKGNIGNQKVFDFISASKTMISSDRVTKCVMVSNTGFTDTAWAAAEKNNLIELIPVRSLEDDLFDLASTYRSFVDMYEAKDIFSEYVALNGTYYDGDHLKKPVSNVESFVSEWMNVTHHRFMMIFGDFGSGKTTLLNRVKYVFAKAYIEGRSSLKPFLINLKDFYKYDTVDKLLTYSAIREFQKDISLQLIYRQIESGQMILLLDGFDEMAQQIDTDVRMRNFLYLSPFLRQRAVITCRPSYFISKSEYINYSDRLSQQSAFNESIDSGTYKRKNMEQRQLMNQLSVYLTQEFITPQSLKRVELMDFETIEIDRLSSTSIDDYLKNHDQAFKETLNVGWADVKNYLLQIYDVTDLMTRPMLLKMIVKTFLSGKFALDAKHIHIGPAGLYDLYTALYLDIDYQKGVSRQLFSAEQRRSLSMSIALLMLEQRSFEVGYEQLLQFITEHQDLQRVLGDVSHLTFEQVVADIQICTFLVASESGKFRFAHKSFMEFFVARYLQQSSLGTKVPEQMNAVLPKEMLYFLGSFSTANPDLDTKLFKWLEKHMGQAKHTKLTRNLASSILYGGAVISDLKWRDLEISHIEFKRRNLRNCHFEKVNFERVEFLNAGFHNNVWKSVFLGQVNLTSCEISGSQWSTIIDEVNLLGGQIHSSSLSFSGKNLTWTKGQIENSNVSFGGSASVTHCIFKSSTLNWDASFPGEVQFQSCNFEQGKVIWPVTAHLSNYRFGACKFIKQTVTLVDSGEPSKIFDRCVFDNCAVMGLRLDVHMLATMSFINCSGYVLIEERAVEQRKDQLAPFKQESNMVFYKRDNLYYIPETTWQLCRKDLKKFQEMLGGPAENNSKATS
jgi:uncharacterized protein YjbI with pentapeptide repeats